MRNSNHKISLILCGYQQVGCDVLKHLLQRSDIDKLAVFTHESGPGVTDLRSFAEEHDIWCSIENINKATLPFQPDIIASVYYRTIISADVIDRVEGRIFNIHPSLLPRHRGCSSVPWAIIEDDKFTGVSFHYIDPAIDTGKILLQSAIQIATDETQASLYESCMKQAAQMWPAALELVKIGFPGIEQQGEKSYHPRGAPHGGQIDDQWSEEKIRRFIRAMIFPPYPYAEYLGQPVKSWSDYQQLQTV